jgi:hypothetical protein
MKVCYEHLTNLAGFQEGDQAWFLPPNSDQREVTEATIITGRTVQGHHPDQ